MTEVMASQHDVAGRAIEISVFPGLYKIDDETTEYVRISSTPPRKLIKTDCLIDYLVSEGGGLRVGQDRYICQSIVRWRRCSFCSHTTTSPLKF